MKKLFLLSFLCLSILSTFSQDLGKQAAMDLVKKNAKSIGLNEESIANAIVSNAYFNETSGTQLVYLQQGYQGLPVYNKIKTLAFKNGSLVSTAGGWIKNLSVLIAGNNAQPSISAETAIRAAMAEKNVFPAASMRPAPITGDKKFDYGHMAVSQENVTAELMWVPTDDNKTVKLAWQIFFAPNTSSDYWLISVDANTSTVIDETNLTVYCGLDVNAKHDHAAECALPSSSKISRGVMGSLESPLIVNNAQYRVIPFPSESPKHSNGTPALVSNPWTKAPGNATSLKWHNDGTADYNYTRGNNVWAYNDRANTNTPSVAASVASTTSPDPLTFDFAPVFTNSPVETNPAPNQQFNVTNLFYWNNVTHDVMYQYGFNEVSGNFQASNQGRGGLGNDYVRAEAQDGGGTNNANFATPADGGSGRMQMYLWDGPVKLLVNTPASIAGTYEAIEGVFSTANSLISKGPISGQLVYYMDSITNTNDACTQASNPSALAGKIALINRNTCSFVIKVKNAQLAGAIAVIMVNNVAGAPIPMGGTDNSITIPAIMVSQSDGAIFASQVGNNVTVNISTIAYDGDVDNGVIVHEYAHGISNRLTAGPAAAGCLSNAEQAGEGWSDYYGLMLTQDWANATVNSGFNSPRSIGTYAVGQDAAGAGIRSKKYSTDFTVNNLVYLNTLPGTGQQHSRGEIWAATLWDMTWNIIQQVNSITPDIYNANGTGGNIIALKLVTEGLKLQPCSPGFIDGRDAILKADQILYNGQYSCAIREAFRRRGMGLNAKQGSSTSATDQTPDYTPYIVLTVKPSVTQALEGTNITYTHTLSSCSGLSNYTLRDTLPTNVTYVSGGTYNAGTRVVSFPVNSASATTQTFAYTVTVNAGSYYAPTTYLNETVATSSIPATLTQTSTTATAWISSNVQSKSAPNSLYSPNATIISDQILATAAAITLGSKQSSLSFWHLYDTEFTYDGGVIEISIDNGISWSDLGDKITTGYYSGTMDDATATPIAGKKAFTGTVTNFIKTNVNLSAFAGASAKFRWRFNSDDGTAQTGWYVDDILVKNEAAVNIRSTLFDGPGNKIAVADTITFITETIVCDNIAITVHPGNTSGCAGGNASFTVTATGSAPQYQWQVSTDAGVTYTNISGATSATLTLTAITTGMNNNRYRIIVSNTCPSSVTSTGAVLSVSSPTTITAQPANTTVCSGENASFSVTATGTGVTYQWQVSTDAGATFTNISGATAATLSLTSVTAAMNNYQYRAVLSTCSPGGLNSNAATLTVNAVAAISTPPANTSACAGGNASFTVVATGTAIAYQWQVSADGGTTYINITGATAATLNLTAVTAVMNNNRYRVVVSNSCPTPATSNGAVLTVANPTVITGQPASTTVCSGANASFTVTATGTAVTYQWQVSTDGGSTFTNISGATTATLSLTSVTAAMNNNQYRAVLSTCSPGGLNSNAVTLTVNAVAVIATQPANTSACTGGNASFTAVATGTAIAYQWQVSADGGATYSNITGANTATLNLSAVTAAMNDYRYRVVASNSCPTPATSNGAILTVANPTVIVGQPASTTVCTGANTTFTVTATGTAVTYQWQVSTNNGTSWTDITGATAASLTLNAVTAAMNNNQYRANLSHCAPGGITTNAAILTVTIPATITTQPASAVACTGTNVTFTAAASGSSLTYQWQVSSNAGTSWTNISGATANSYSLNGVTAAMNGNQYRLVVNGTCVPASVTSSVATLTVNNSITITNQPASLVACSGTNVTFTTAASGSGLTYQWQVSTNGGSTFSNIAGATSATLNLPLVTKAQNGNQYKAILNGACGSNMSTNVATLGVPMVSITASPSTTLSPGATTTLSATVSPAGAYTYQWFKDNAAVSGATGNSLMVTADGVGVYKVLASSAACPNVFSDSLTLRASSNAVLFVYPNPNRGVFQVRYYNAGTSTVKRSITVYDSKGAKVYYKQYDAVPGFSRLEVTLKKAMGGIYTIDLRDNEGARIANSAVMIE